MIIIRRLEHISIFLSSLSPHLCSPEHKKALMTTLGILNLEMYVCSLPFGNQGKKVFRPLQCWGWCWLLIFKGAHGFMTTHKWHNTIGAVINIEAAGTGGPGKIYSNSGLCIFFLSYKNHYWTLSVYQFFIY